MMNVRSGSSRTRLSAAAGGLTLLLASLANAAPSISGISGSATNGAVITVTGSGFGSGDSSPLLWDDFEDSSVSAGARMAGSPQVGSWSPDGGATSYSTAQKNSGSRSLNAIFTPSAQWSNFTVDMPNGDKFFQSFWFRYEGSGTQGQVKLALVHGNSGKGEFAPTVNNNSSTNTWWMSNVATESVAGTNSGSWTTNPGNGSWHHFEMAMQQSSGGGADGSITVWLDGVQQYSKKNIVTRDSSAYYWNEMGFLHGVTNMGTTTNTYLDDVYANNSWARVVLCDAATYSSCKHSEIQPAQAWADGSVTVRVALSAFSNPANAYLYVVDANGSANANGFKLCSSCTVKVPSAPTLNGVQ